MPKKQIDERDIMFSRMSLKEGSTDYKDYYQRNPKKKEIDSKLRNMPYTFGEGSSLYDPVLSKIPDSGFSFLSQLKKLKESEVNPKRTEINIKKITEIIKELAIYMQAAGVGIIKMKKQDFYSHRGRDRAYGDKVTCSHSYGIVFAFEMDKEMINRAPQTEQTIAVTKAYIDCASAGMWISNYIKELGYNARNHFDGNYLSYLPPLAERAGLGEIGRHSLLVHPQFGARIRLGLITTDLPMIIDEKKSFGLNEFCDKCNLCAENCPGRAIKKGLLNKTDRITISQEDCYRIWRKLGTDCGVCLSSCPFSQGITKNITQKLKGNDALQKKILKKHKKKFGRRKYNKTAVRFHY